VQAHIEVRIFAGEVRRLLCMCFGDHQAGASEDSIAMRLDDAGIDFARESEIVGVYDEGFHGVPNLTASAGARILLASQRRLK